MLQGNLKSSVYYVNQQLKGHIDTCNSSEMTESSDNYIISPNFSGNSNPAFVDDDEGVDEEERPSTYSILDRGFRGQGVASTSPSAAQPHGLTNETVIKYVKADYEELPNSSAGIQDEMSGYTHIDDGSVVVGAGPFYRSGGVGIPDGKQQLVSPKKEIDGKARRRSNPLYDFPAVTRFPAGGVYPLSNPQGPCGSSWFCCALQTLCLLLAAAALVLAIISIVTEIGGGGQVQAIDRKDFEELVQRYQNLESSCSILCRQITQTALSNTSDLNSFVQDLLRNNSELQKSIFDLQLRVQSLETTMRWQSGYNQNLSFQVDSQTKQISRLDTETTNITSAVDNLKKNLSYQISQIPRGLVNLTSCGHYVESSGTSVHQTVTTTNTLNLNTSAVLSVVCSTEGGTQAFLRSDRNFPYVYSCECSGQTNSSVVSRYCIIHYWTCPILT